MTSRNSSGSRASGPRLSAITCGMRSMPRIHPNGAAAATMAMIATVSRKPSRRMPGQVAPAEALVGQLADDDRVHHGDRARLGGGERADAHAADDADRHEQRGDRIPQGAAALGERGRLARGLEVAPRRLPVDDQHHRGGHQQARDDAGGEQRPHGHRAERGEDDEPDAGRDQVVDRRGGGAHGGGERARVPARRHLGDEHLRGPGGDGERRARQAAHHGVRHDVDLREARPAGAPPSRMRSARGGA